MTAKRFTLRTEPLVAEVGDSLTLEFQPETGTEFLDAYQELLDSQKTDAEDAASAKARILATREFLAQLALKDSADKLRDPSVSIPLRVLTGLIEWLTQEYTGSDVDGGAKGARPTSRR